MSVLAPSPEDSCPILQSSLLGVHPHAFSTRHGGVSPRPFRSLNVGLSTADERANVLENRRRLIRAARVEGRLVIGARLVHGANVARFHANRRTEWPLTVPGAGSDSMDAVTAAGADAVVSDAADIAFFMTFADCVPLLFADSSVGVVGAAHAGWRGTALGVGTQTISVMCEEFGCHPANIVAAIGPSIGPCCYAVAEEVTARFAACNREPVLKVGPRNDIHLDLWETNRRQLLAAGLQGENIDVFRLCTGCNTDDFYSHRREHGCTGRAGACIGVALSR